MPSLFICFVLLFLFNTSIATMITIIVPESGFITNMLISHCIGFCVAPLNIMLSLKMAPGRKRWMAYSVVLPSSVILGLALAYALAGLISAEISMPPFWRILAVGLIFSLLGSIVFLLASRLESADSELRQKKMDEVESEQRELAAHLKLLQAQIEPHFLFNTLANVTSLLETEPQQAKELLDRLISWLRLALERSRREHASLGDEIEQLKNWLNILTIRFGDRLRWSFDIPEEVQRLSFPPMLLQPLVENAVRHGIEPRLGGGKVEVRAWVNEGKLRIEVIDDGLGLNGSCSVSTGTGLENVRSRLAILYGPEAHLEITSREDSGVTATLELPCAS